MIVSSPVRLQEQNAACALQPSAVQIHHQFVHAGRTLHAPLATEAPTSVLQPALTAVPPSPPPSGHLPSWSAAAAASCLPAATVEFGAASTTTSPTDTDLDMTALPTPAAFQQLLDSFGCQSDADEDDDTVVNLDAASMSLHGRPSSRHPHLQQPMLQSIIQPQRHAVCSAARC